MFKIEGLMDLKQVIKGKDDYKPYPTVVDRKSWQAIPINMKKTILEAAESYLDFEGPLPKATQMMDFIRTGNRVNYQERAAEQRKALLALVFGECIENQGRFIDDIINIVWQLCEQTTWVLPAHYSLFNREDKAGMLPDVKDNVIDLFAGEVSVLLAFTHYLLKPSLDEVTPAVCQRISYELSRRIIEPYIMRRDMWWMGYSGRRVNNWAPWCASNCLMTTLLIENDTYKRSEVVRKTMEIMESFIEVYHDDGGCDEGTSYWDRAGGSLFDCLEILYTCTDGNINYYHEPLIKNIGEYIYKSHIDDTYFVNYADGGAKVDLDLLLVYRYGKCVQSEPLKQVTGRCYHENIAINPVERGILRGLPYLFQWEEFETYANSLDKSHKVAKLDHVLQDIQVVTYRETERSDKGLFLSAKGGHNDESHNHNDIGQYIVYKDGKPVIIDAGCGVYTRKTFSPQRYEIWTMQSSYHNLPEVNGISQAYGSEYRPSDVNFDVNDEQSSISMNIASAYPRQAKIESWVRSCALCRKPSGQIVITDSFTLEEASSNVMNVMMTCCEPKIDEVQGVITLEYAPEHMLTLSYDHSGLEAASEMIELDDEKLCSVWGSKIYRIIFKTKETVRQGEFIYHIH